MKYIFTYFHHNTLLAFLGLIIGTLVTTAPFVFTNTFENWIHIPGEYAYLIGFALIVLSFLMYLMYSAFKWLIARFKRFEFSQSYIFLILIFIHIFFAGFRLDISNLVLIIYIFTFSVLLSLRKIERIIVTPIFYFMIVHFLFCNISLLLPHSIGVTFTYSNLLKLNIKLLVVFLVLNSLMTEKELEHFFRLYIVMCIFTSLVAVIQAVIFYGTGINYSFAGPNVKRVVVSPIGIYPRVSGFFKHPTVMATDISPMFIMMLYGFLSPEYIPRRQRTIILSIMGLMLIPLFLSTARGTWVAMFFGCLAIFLLKKPNLLFHKLIALTFLFFISYVTGLLGFAYDILVSLNEASVSSRYGLFELGLEAIKEYPILGYGFNNFSSYTGNYTRLSVHSSPFQILSETGILGLITYFCLLGYIFWRILSQLRKTVLGMNRLILEAYFVALITLITNNFFQQITWATFTFLFLALGDAIARIVKASEEAGRELKLI
ncbi:MAG: O-antigen ligase family protein [Candidatus Glassbacteria bacterium]